MNSIFVINRLNQKQILIRNDYKKFYINYQEGKSLEISSLKVISLGVRPL